jgi:hypothetical protein
MLGGSALGAYLNWAEAIDCGAHPEHSWYECASHGDLEPEWFSSFDDYDAETYWCGFALCWFVRQWERLHA